MSVEISVIIKDINGNYLTVNGTDTKEVIDAVKALQEAKVTK